MNTPELASIEAFAEHLMDDHREAFTFADARAVASCARVSTNVVIAELRSYGFAYEPRPVEKTVRGIGTKNDRWTGAGHHGGGGGEDILTGFAGKEG